MLLAFFSIFALNLVQVHSLWFQSGGPKKLTAGASTHVDIGNDLTSNHSVDAKYQVFNVYLASSMLSDRKGRPGTMCVLRTNVRINTVHMDIFVSPSVGPADANYHLSVLRYNSSTNHTADKEVLSRPFSIIHARDNFSDQELRQTIWWHPKQVPCNSYPCVRSCLNKEKREWNTCFGDCNGVSIAYP